MREPPSSGRRCGMLPLLLLALSAGAAAIAENAAPARNLIVVAIDSLRADHLSIHGYPRETMPELARHVARGPAVVFSRATAVTASCHPSHTAMLTGLYPQQVGVPGCGEDLLLEDFDGDGTSEPLQAGPGVPEQPPPLVRKRLSAAINWLAIPRDQETLATYFARHGFRTGGFVSIWTITGRFGYDLGFDVFEDAQPEYYGPNGAGRIVREVLRANRRQVGGVTMDHLLRFLDAADDERRFFAFVHLADAHEPYAPRDIQSFVESAEARARVEAAWDARYPDATRERAMRRMGRGGSDFLLDQYDRALRYVDRELGRLFDWLDRSGHRSDTLVLISADHGDSMGQHFYLSDRFRDRLFFEHSVHVWEETQHVPMVLFDPAAENRVDSRNVSHVDIAPTVLRRLGFDPASFGDVRLPGRDMLDGDAGPRTVFFLTFGRGEPGPTRPLVPDFPKFVGFRRDDLKFFVDRARFKSASGGSCYLYDLATDPHEQRNLCPSSPEQGRYRDVLVDWYSRSLARRTRERPASSLPR